MARQVPVLKQMLPILPIASGEEKIETEETTYLAEHICEPSSQELLGELLPKNVYVQLYSALLETSTSEHAARMAAMDNATKACKDMIENLTLLYNKARQAAITAELMDIVGGAEALKG
jgi:F-type H+-transporting ATPase subunit gamma